MIVFERRHGELLCSRIEHQIQAADVTPIRMTRQRLFFDLRMSDLDLTGRATPRHWDLGVLRAATFVTDEPERVNRLRTGGSSMW